MIEQYNTVGDRTEDAVLLSYVSENDVPSVIDAKRAIWISAQLDQEAVAALVNIRDYRFMAAFRKLYAEAQETGIASSTLVRFAQDAINHKFHDVLTADHSDDASEELKQSRNLGSAAHAYKAVSGHSGFGSVPFNELNSEHITEVEKDEKCYLVHGDSSSNVVGLLHADDLEFLQRARQRLNKIAELGELKDQSITEMFAWALLEHYQGITGDNKIDVGIYNNLLGQKIEAGKGGMVQLPKFIDPYMS